MTRAMQSGLVIRGTVVPNTDWIIRDPDAWFDLGTADAPLRKRWPITKFTGHWTGGGVRTGIETARRVVAAMKARLREDGTPMSVSVPFVGSWDGLVFQTCDLAAMAIHAGRVVNEDSVAIELTWPGYLSQARKLKVIDAIAMPRTVNGERVTCMKPSEKMMEACVRLAELLASLPESSGVKIPRIVAPDRRFKPHEARAFAGGMEHANSPGSSKLDAAGLVRDALVERAGWKRAA